MNTNLVTTLLFMLCAQSSVIEILMILNFAINYKNAKPEGPLSLRYQQFQIDQPPLIEKIDYTSYHKRINDYFLATGKKIRPVQRRGGAKVPSHVKCPYCKAPHKYLYRNNGNKGNQYRCKVCHHNFNIMTDRDRKPFTLRCPHCAKPLDRIKERDNFNVYKCRNDQCSFYLNNLAAMSDADRDRFECYPTLFKVRYIHRVFNGNFKELSRESIDLPKVDLSRIHAPHYILGLILSYRINYGLTARKVSQIMREVHCYKVSAQTVLNYCEAAGYIVKPFLDTYDYDLSGSYAGDETYIKIRGKHAYIFYFIDTVKKILLSYYVSERRTSTCAMKALAYVREKLSPYDGKPTFITDGNPIYKLAQYFYAEPEKNGGTPEDKFVFDLVTVYGLTNDDPISTEYRPLKQIIERLNRTFRASYRLTNGYHAYHGSVSHVNLFAVHFNFLRTHRSLGNKVPVPIPEIEKQKDMPNKWVKLLHLSQEKILELQRVA